MTDTEMLAQAREIACDLAQGAMVYDRPPNSWVPRLMLALSWAKESIALQAAREAIKGCEMLPRFEEEALALVEKKP